MTTRYSASAVWTLAVVAMATLTLSAAPASAEIIYDGFASWTRTTGVNTYDASASDKLVVAVAGEHHFPGNYTGNVTGITYNGQTLIKAVEESPSDPATGGHGQTTADIWYLDNPSLYTGAGTIVVSFTGNSWCATAIGLSGTAAGVGATAHVSGAASVNLTTTAADSFVIASLGGGGQGNTASPAPPAVSPMTPISGVVYPSNYAGLSTGYQSISLPGAQTFSFNTTKTDVVTIAAEIKQGAPPRNLTLRVDPVTGATTLLGDPTRVIAINYYEITSADDSLDSVNWSSLSDQDFEGSGPPNGTGNGWEEAGGAGKHALAEAFLLGDSTIAAAQSVSLGSGYDAFVGVEDLVFTYRTDAGAIIEGLVEYVTSVIAGDANWDGVVDAADYIELKRNFGMASVARYQDGDFNGDHAVDWNDLQTLMGNFGARGVGGAPAAPEPGSVMLLMFGAAAMLRRRRKA